MLQLGASEIDESSFGFRMHEFYAHAIADLESFPPTFEPAFNRWTTDAHPRTFLGRTGDDRIESLADPVLQQERRGCLSHEALYFVRGVFAFGASLTSSGRAVGPSVNGAHFNDR